MNLMHHQSFGKHWWSDPRYHNSFEVMLISGDIGAILPIGSTFSESANLGLAGL